jgi:cysteinyl-tRNA synthetase
MKIMKIYNSLTFQKEEFKTLRPNDVLMYVCGPTVYDSPHLGHAKSAVAFDIIRRYFRFKGYNVKMVKNYTDIDDKIIKRAKEINIDFKTLSDKYIKEYEEIMKILNIQKDYKNPRATDIIDFMIEFIEKLISKGHAYEKNGSVYFSVKSFPDYNKLLQNKRTEEGEEEDLEDQDTIYNDDKLDPRDFALWKKMKEGEPYWESPWGKGRPGWHIECSAMAINYLGETIDVHGGGQDLKFPHHRNEIAQSEAYTGKPFAKFFMHNGFVNVDNEKMSKSLGNFFLVSDVVKKFNPMVIRFFLISSHYRKSINYSLKTISQAKKNYDKLINTIQKINDIASEETDSIELENLISKIDIVKENIINAMDDDFNTAVAIAEIMSFFREINQIILEKNVKINSKFKDKFFNFIKDVDDIFGLFPKLKKELHLGIAGEFDDRGVLINNLLEIIKDIRSKLRERKIYDISDEIRKKLRDLGIKIEDLK